jgi:hypothetical protein
MATSSPRQRGERHADTSSRQAKLRTDAKHVVWMTLAFFAVAAMILRTTVGIWSTSVSRWGTAGVVIVEILRHGDILFIVRYTQILVKDWGIKERERN